MANIASVTKYFPVASEAYSSSLASSITAGATTVPVNDASAYNDGDTVVLTVDFGTALQATFTGTKSGSSFINCVWTEGNVGASHTTGAKVQDIDSATHFGIVTKGMRVQHNNDGTHSAITATTIANTGNYSQTAGSFSLPDGVIQANALGSSAITLGYTTITSDFSTANQSATQVTGLSATVTVPNGGRRVKITVGSQYVTCNGSANVVVTIWDGTVGTGTLIGQQLITIGQGGWVYPVNFVRPPLPAAGSKTYNVGFHTSANIAQFTASSSTPAFILVEAI